MKATSQELSFHKRIMSRDDPTAFAELCEWMYGRLVAETQARAGTDSDPDLVEEAVGQALMNYEQRPGQYDPARMGLERYLVMAAYHDYKNALAKEHRHRGSKGAPASLYLSSLAHNEQDRDIEDEAQNIELLLRQMQADALWDRVYKVFPNPSDQQVMHLIADGVRSTKAYAEILGIDALPPEEQAAIVKRVKDRITKRLRRLGKELGRDLDERA